MFHPQPTIPAIGQSHSQNYYRNNRPVLAHSKGEYSRNVNYPSAGLDHQNGGPMYASRQMVQPPNVVRAQSYQVGYYPYQNYQQPGASHQQRGNWAPMANQSNIPGGRVWSPSTNKK
jgi:hypothetical protein